MPIPTIDVIPSAMLCLLFTTNTLPRQRYTTVRTNIHKFSDFQDSLYFKVGVTSVEALQPVAPPYPKIFEQDHLKIASTVATSWQSARSTGSLVGKTTERLARINLRKFHRFVEAGLEQDDLAEVIEDLKSLENCYNPDKFQGWDDE